MKAYENRAVFTGRVVKAELDDLVVAAAEDRAEAEGYKWSRWDDYDHVWIPDSGFGWGTESDCLAVLGVPWMREALLAGLARKAGPVLGRIAA